MESVVETVVGVASFSIGSEAGSMVGRKSENGAETHTGICGGRSCTEWNAEPWRISGIWGQVLGCREESNMRPLVALDGESSQDFADDREDEESLEYFLGRSIRNLPLQGLAVDAR